jgi:TolA-binding protein
MLRRAAALALLTLTTAVAPAVTAPAQETEPHRPIDLRYDGKYRNDPWWEAQPARFRRAAEEGFKRATDGLGIDRTTLDVSQFRVYMEDARPDTGTWARYTQPYMQCFGYPGDAGGIQLRVTTESMRNGFGADLATGMTHELTHALMRATCPNYRMVPKWIREGMAVYLAGQGPGRITSLLTRPKYAGAPVKLLNGLEGFGGKHTLDDYVEDYLAMVYLDSLGGDDGRGGVKQLQAALAAKRPWRTALREISGLAWPDFQRAAKAFAVAELAKRDTDDLKQYAQVATLRMSRRYAEAIAAADAHLKQYPRSPYRKMSLYHRARAHYATKRYPHAIADFAGAHAVGVPFTGYDDDLLFWWGWCLYKTRKYAEAATKFEEVLRDHPGYADPTAAAYFWALSLGNAGDASARAVLTKAMSAFPAPKESWMLPAARKMLAKLDGEKK